MGPGVGVDRASLGQSEAALKSCRTALRSRRRVREPGPSKTAGGADRPLNGSLRRWWNPNRTSCRWPVPPQGGSGLGLETGRQEGAGGRGAGRGEDRHSVVAAEYRGLTVSQMTDLRAKARRPGVYMRVVKNTLARSAVAGTPFECVGRKLKGPLVLAFSKEDPGAAARVVKEFAKDNDKLVATLVSSAGQVSPPRTSTASRACRRRRRRCRNFSACSRRRSRSSSARSPSQPEAGAHGRRGQGPRRPR